MSLFSAIADLMPFKKAVLANTQEGWVDVAWDWNYWQLDKRPVNFKTNSVVESCMAAIAQTVSVCPLYHQERLDNGGLRDIKGSALARLLHYPNEYQSRSDMLLNVCYSILGDGNAYLYKAKRNNRNEPTELHLLNPTATRGYRLEDGSVVYGVNSSGWDLRGELDFHDANYVPARDIVHFKLHTPYDPLRGVSPIQAAALSIATNSTIMNHEATFFKNMSRPSGVLSTDAGLTKEQMVRLRDAWTEKSKGINAGEVPILANGLKWYPLSISSQDAQLIEVLKFTVEDISRVFRVPLPMINSMTTATFNNAETMLNWWLASGLGFMLDHIEQAFAHSFRLPPNEELNFDTNILLRVDFKTRIAALGEATMKGVYALNEARAKEGLEAAEYGDEPRVQQQVVPLSYYYEKLKLDKEALRLQQEQIDNAAEAAEDAAEAQDDQGEQDEPSEEEETAQAKFLVKQQMRMISHA